MRFASCAMALCVAACGAPGPSIDAGTDAGGPVDAGNSALEQAWLDAHNTQRSNAMPVPSPALPPLSWNAGAASTAQTWANRCQFVHNTGSGYGENLYAASGGAASTPASVVTDWASEKVSYTYATNTCAAGQQCGHYTQVVWRATTSVGCATATCSTNSPFGSGNWELTVCDYDPPGNFVGQKPY